jgi:hypothetical protein
LFPAKKLVGNNDENFTKERANALEVYVDKLAHHPALNNSLDLIVFLDSTDEGLEAAKRYIEEKSTEDAESMLVKGTCVAWPALIQQCTPRLFMLTVFTPLQAWTW